MISLYWLKLRHIFSFILTKIMSFVISLARQKVNDKNILFVRLDSIGDYILLRNFFQFIRKDERYQKYKITLCGNIIWKELAEYFDKTVFDNFIWLDRQKFQENIFYRYYFLKKIYKLGFEVAIDTTYSREILFGDSIVAISKAKERIGCTGSIDNSAKWKRNLLSDTYYTKLLVSDNENLFEFYRNKDFFEKLLNRKLEIERTCIDVPNISFQLPTQKKYILIFPGAQYENRIWKPENYAKVIEEIFNSTEYDVIITGSSAERPLAEVIVNFAGNSRLFDLTGKTSLIELVKLVSGAKMVIANETMAVHIAAAVKAPFVCISNGQHFGRFNPYPEEMFEDGYYIYPEEISDRIDQFQNLTKEYRFEAIHDINSIRTDKVTKLVRLVLSQIEERNK